MKIKKINVYQVDLPLVEKKYKWSGGKYVETFDSTIVEIETDNGIIGYGECCPLGPVYLPSYALGVRSGIKEIGPKLINENPLESEKLNLIMDKYLKGHPYVKSAIDIACWDIKGKILNMSLCEIFGGRFGDDLILYRAISQMDPDEMANNVKKYKKMGYTKFQLKVGGNANEDIERIKLVSNILDEKDTLIADANTGWLMHDAMRVVKSVENLNVYIEQPCLSYQECKAIRKSTSNPFILDENINDINILIRGYMENAMDVVNIKISKFGGLTKSILARNLCVKLGIAMTIEDTWGGDVITSAIAHLAQSTPQNYLFSTTDFNSYVTTSTANGAPTRKNGKMKASKKPGLGIEIKKDVLGKSLFEIE